MKRHAGRVLNEIGDCFFILEHESVFTLGKRGGVENLILDRGIPVEQTDRGGNITYHGPGQIIIYPVINIKEIGIGIKEYIKRLEDVVINTLLLIGLESERNDLNHGVWVKNKKIASVGVRVSHGVTLHGIAININTDLEPFSRINPCGLTGVVTTSAKKILSRDFDIERIENLFSQGIIKSFPECFCV